MDIALNSKNKTAHKMLSESCGSELEAVAKASEVKILKRLGNVMSKARYVLCAFEEDVKDEDDLASTTLTASARMLLAPAIDRKNEQYTVLTADL